MQEKLSHILFLTIDFPPMGGGMAVHSYNTVKALHKVKESPVVLTTGVTICEEPETEKCFPILRLRSVCPGTIFDGYVRSTVAFFLSAFRFCLTHRVKAVCANTWSIAGVAAYFIKAFLGIPYIVFAHGFDVYSPQNSKKMKWLMRLVLKNSRVVIANSNFTKGLIRTLIPEGKITVLHPAIDTCVFPRETDTQKNGTDRKIILTVGRLVESKGHEAVIRALPEVLERFPEAVYQIVGEGPTEDALKILVRKLGLVDKVNFIKNVDDRALELYYRSCDVFVMPSREIKARGEVEGFGIVFLEAAACGKPVVAGRSGGMSDAVVDGHTGILVDPLNSEEISSAIIKLLSNNETARNMGENGKKRVALEFGINKFGERLKELIDHAVDT